MGNANQEYCLSADDYDRKLNEQVTFLQSSIKAYSDFENEAIRVALAVRVLVHDTKHSTSLLTSLKKKDIVFVDSSCPNDGCLHSMTGMVGVRAASCDYWGLVAKINKNGDLIAVPLFQQHLMEWHKGYRSLSFRDWWDMEVVTIGEFKLCRKDLILYMANKDGGAHVESKLPKEYAVIKSTSLKLKIHGKEACLDGNAAYASVVQIGWELLRSIGRAL